MREARLESWKEISTYLNRGIRTVQRWEKQEGLPVHRHTHEKLGSVFAYPSEIDAWWESRQASLAVAHTNGTGPSAEGEAAGPNRRWSLLPVVVAAAALLATGALVVAVRPPNTKSSEWMPGPLSPVSVTTLPGSELFPSFSPDGSSVVFSWSRPGHPVHLFIRTIGTETHRQLTGSRKSDLGAAWSPNGKLVAFLRGRPSDGPLAEIMVVSPAGGEAKPVATTERDWGPYLAWTPDSHGLVYSNCVAPAPCFLKMLRLDSGETSALTKPPAGTPGDTSPALSPDGRSLLFLRRNGATTTINLQKLSASWTAEGPPVALTPAGEFSTAPAWAADGKTFFFLTGEEGLGMKLWRMEARVGGERVLLATLGDTLYEPGITVSGNKVATVELRCDFNIHRAPPLDPASQTRHAAITQSNRNDTFPHVSPDGRRVVFESTRNGGSDIFMMNLDGSGVTQLTFFGKRRAKTPRWSPDAKHVVFAVGVSPGDLYTVPSAGGKPRLILGGPENDMLPSWSPDGKWIYFTSTRSAREEIWKVHVDGGSPLRLTSGGGFRPIAAADGQSVYYTRRSREAAHGASLWRVSVDGGGEERVFEPLVFHPENFEVAGGGIYFSGRSSNGIPHGVQFFDTATKSLRQVLTLNGPPGKGLTVAGGGDTLLFSRLDYHNADLVMFEVP